MTDSATLLALADRCEAATGPDRELDRDIALLRGEYDQPEDLGCFYDLAEAVVSGGGQTYAPLAYTASLDAAMTLANGFILLHLSDIGADGLPLCRLGDPSTTPTGEWVGIASGLERAVVAAALRALASQVQP